jgi:hypothetical protein
VLAPAHAATLADWLASRDVAGEPVFIGGVNASRIALSTAPAVAAPVVSAGARDVVTEKSPPTARGHRAVDVDRQQGRLMVDALADATCPASERPGALVMWHADAALELPRGWAVPVQSANDGHAEGCILAIDVTFR